MNHFANGDTVAATACPKRETASLLLPKMNWQSAWTYTYYPTRSILTTSQQFKLKEIPQATTKTPATKMVFVAARRRWKQRELRRVWTTGRGTHPGSTTADPGLRTMGAYTHSHQSLRRVLCIDSTSTRVGFVGPDLIGRCKWYDGAIYEIPQNMEGCRGSMRALQIQRVDASHHPRTWTGLSWAEGVRDGPLVVLYPLNISTIVCVPNNAVAILCVVPLSLAAYPLGRWSAGEHRHRMEVEGTTHALLYLGT